MSWGQNDWSAQHNQVLRNSQPPERSDHRILIHDYSANNATKEKVSGSSRLDEEGYDLDAV